MIDYGYTQQIIAISPNDIAVKLWEANDLNDEIVLYFGSKTKANEYCAVLFRPTDYPTIDGLYAIAYKGILDFDDLNIAYISGNNNMLSQIESFYTRYIEAHCPFDCVYTDISLFDIDYGVLRSIAVPGNCLMQQGEFKDKWMNFIDTNIKLKSGLCAMCWPSDLASVMFYPNNVFNAQLPIEIHSFDGIRYRIFAFFPYNAIRGMMVCHCVPNNEVWWYPLVYDVNINAVENTLSHLVFENICVKKVYLDTDTYFMTLKMVLSGAFPRWKKWEPKQWEKEIKHWEDMFDDSI